MKHLKYYIIAILWGCCYTNANSTIYINELMQSNIDCIMDDLNEFPDSWLELYNSSDSDVNIKGYTLSLNEDGSEGYVLPSAIVPAKGFLIIYCDKEANNLHASFRIDSGKGSLYLFDNNGNLIDGIEKIKKQPAPNIAYGRVNDGSKNWGYQISPSPGAPNTGEITEDVLDAPLFSIPGGVWSEQIPIDLELSLPDSAPSNAIIRYTLDGKEPTLENGLTYSTPIAIRESVCVRAKIFADGFLSIPSSVQSYIFMDREQKIPLISIVIDPDYLYDDAIGIFVEGEGGADNPNYKNDWRRPLNLEYFPVEEEAALNQLCEMRVQGGATRSLSDLKTVAVYANKRFGTKRFDYEFWSNDKPGVTDNKSFLLRHGGNDFGRGYYRDALCQRMIGRHTDVDWQGYAPTLVYINGKYHAMLAIRERSNEDNIYANYEGMEDIDMIENWTELKEGTLENFNAFKNFYTDSEEHELEDWSEWMDLEEYTNMMIGEIWAGNSDFPHNNIVLWRPREDSSKWRWLIKDMDFGLGLYTSKPQLDSNYNFFNWLYEATTLKGSKIFQQLMLNDDYKNYFVNHWIAYTGDFLNEEKWLELFDEIQQENFGEQLISDLKWDNPYSDPETNWERIPKWINERQSYAPIMLQEFFGLDEIVPVTINQSYTPDQLQDVTLSYNNIPLTQPFFDGTDYRGRNILIEADGDINGWEVTIGSKKKIFEGNSLSLDITETEPIAINILSAAGMPSIEIISNTIRLDRNTGCVYMDGPIIVYDIQGRWVTSSEDVVQLPSRGCYIINNTKVIW